MNVPRAMNLPPSPKLTREDRKEFGLLAKIAEADAGLIIPEEKAPMLFARLNKRLRALGIKSRAEYCRLVSTPEGKEERNELISTLTTNVTSFFRENHHFETLAMALESSLKHKLLAGESLRIWSAGCSSGQEAYSIGMVVLERIPDARNYNVRILATDIDQHVLSIARNGVFEASQVQAIPTHRRDRFFHRRANNPDTGCTFEACEELKKIITFRNLNLLSNWPMKCGFDVIFCRNVIIYFNKSTQNSLWPRFEHSCLPGGVFILGAFGTNRRKPFRKF